MLLYALLGLLVGSLLRAGSDALPVWRRDLESGQRPNRPAKPWLAWLDLALSFLRRRPHACDATGVSKSWGSERRLSSVAYRNQVSDSTDNPLGPDAVLSLSKHTSLCSCPSAGSEHRPASAGPGLFSQQSPDVYMRPDATPWRGLLLELVTMLLFAYLWRHYGPSLQLVLATLYTCLFLLIFVIDLEHRLVLNVVVLPASLLALSISFISPNPGPGNALLGGALGFGLFALVALAYRGGMGAGDVKLAGLIGLITGFPLVVVALAIGVLIGGLVALLLLLTKVKGRKSYIPYAPFLVMGGMVTMLYGPEIMAWYASIVNR